MSNHDGITAPWLQVTELLGAEGNDHLVFLNSGEVKRSLMGSLAGPESPNPWSHRMKEEEELRAIGSASPGYAVAGGRGNTMKRTVKLTVTVNAIAGFRKVNKLEFIFGFSWRYNFPRGS